MPRNKNFYRYPLLELAEIHGTAPLLFTGIYKHAENSDWVTLSTIKLQNSTSQKTLCSHVNLSREEFDKHLKLSRVAANRKICFWGEIISYPHYGNIRGGIKLSSEAQQPRVWIETKRA